MFKKRNFRKKPAEQDEGDNGGEEEGSVAPPSTQAVPSEKPAKVKSKKFAKSSSAGLLSFEDEEEEGPALMLSKSSKDKPTGGKSEFKSKKDRVKQKEQARNADKEEGKGSTQRPQAGMYTAEMLQQLRSETKTIGGSSSKSADPVIKLSGSFKPAAASSGDMLMDGLVAVRPESQTAPQTLEAETTLASSRNNSASGSAARSKEPAEAMPDKSGGDFFIPDAAAIKAAKAKRERMRNAAATPDFMPLRSEPEEGGLRVQKVGKEDGEHSSGEEEDDDDVRLQFLASTKASKSKNSGGGVFQTSAETAEGDGDEDEEESWVLEQLKKGVSGYKA
eukprot:CAMPEP_0118953802 /NCGR_PEP_ID=MMETSP1169-20130426/57215_1 /TAXON_ID=36882 /ORGANISM="Pyramimonas obovata, Strain CCMP722" /LENGTH=333 /DNA_ID=CAMNT_0006901341 /DNA_START=186 /DNA_END=1183 /DNA_ORIENTATION=-